MSVTIETNFFRDIGDTHFLNGYVDNFCKKMLVGTPIVLFSDSNHIKNSLAQNLQKSCDNEVED